MSGLLDKAKEAEASKKVVTESVKIAPEISEPVTSSITDIKPSAFSTFVNVKAFVDCTKSTLPPIANVFTSVPTVANNAMTGR